MKAFPILIVSTLLTLYSCVPDVTYKSVDEFNISEGLINNNEKIKLLYSSATPPDEEKLTYFIHLMAERTDTDDTLNILTIFNRGAGKGDSKNEFIFYTIDSEEGKAYFEKLKESYQFEKSLEDIYTIDRVTYDKRFNFFTKNDYPTVIGFIDKEK